jgi:hypothetical protein
VRAFARAQIRKTAITRLVKDNTACGATWPLQAVGVAKGIYPSTDKIYVGAVGNDATIIAHLEELVDSFAAIRAVVESAVVDVHADESVGESGIEVAGKLHGVSEGLFAVIKGVLDAVAQRVGRSR